MIEQSKLYKQLFASLIMFFALAFNANAVEHEAYSAERFKALQATGEVVLLDISADWCPTCAKQQVVLEKYRTANPDKNLHILRVDFDKQKNVVRQLRAPRQSTLLLYKGQEQFWYSVAETRYEVIEAEINKAFNFKSKK
ncbi:MAG: thioredoxin [Betaproteobacteria bacterium HGW-Betaproteobacteria-22]|nr:MAG: thioredoxin [Betaproteobacteria bacterium HGW-Betaproteobacteria-22]